jgi:uncharacterized protein (TIGR00369 family)
MASFLRSIEELNAWGRDRLPGLVGFEVLDAVPGNLKARMRVRPDLLAPNGYLHAASVIALADSACGYGTMFDLPDGASGFTTIELKSNFVSTLLEGTAVCQASRVHKGRTTQIWDAVVGEEGNDKTLALFRCTQMILYPR